MPAATRLVALSAIAVVACTCALFFAASVPIELLEAPSHPADDRKVINS
jgi:hypothetical protein